MRSTSSSRQLCAYYRAEIAAVAERYTSTGAAMPAPEATSEPPHRYNTENKEEIGISTRYTVAECNGLEGDITEQNQGCNGVSANSDAFDPDAWA